MNANKITIGRDPKNDIRIDDHWDTVSNRHGEISYSNGQLTFTDHSSNGTVINGQKIQNTAVGIYRGDSIRLANAFNLEWSVIERFFPEMNRPTV
ncbi:MAG: FHA domain-containing protein, partial [Muribaculaceae bacterium]|nr:FHA domain-containing protein [Muribaculaceae bacterium]